MTEQETNLVLEHLKRIKTKLSVIEADIGDLKTRMSATEVHMDQLTTLMGGLNQRMDRFDERLARIERLAGSRGSMIMQGFVKTEALPRA
jgi:hypothetical protein